MSSEIERKLEREGHKFKIEGLDLPKRYSPEVLKAVGKFVTLIGEKLNFNLGDVIDDSTRVTGCEVRNDVAFPGKILITPHVRNQDGEEGQESTEFCEIVNGKIVLPASSEGLLYLQDIIDLIEKDPRCAVLIKEAKSFA